MHRLGSSALLLVVGLALVSCGGGGGGSSPRPSCSTAAEGTACGTNQVCHAGSCVTAASLTVYWSFLRHVVQPTPGTVPYDTARSPGGATGPCTDTLVDAVGITDAAGNPIDPANPTYPCIISGTQGVTVPGLVPGTYDLIFTGYQGTLALYQQRVSLSAAAASVNTYDVVIPGIQDDFDVLVQFYDVSGINPVIPNTCDAPTLFGPVATIEYNLLDGSGTVVAAGSLACANPPHVSFLVANGTGIDRDLYTIRLRGIDITATRLLEDSATTQFHACAAVGIPHLGPGSAGAQTWTMPMLDVSTDPALGQGCP